MSDLGNGLHARPGFDEGERRDPGPQQWPDWTGRALLGCWWGLIFLATHVPMPVSEGPSPLPDKLIHYVMYFGLGLLLPLWRGWGQRMTMRTLATDLAILAGYAAVDELLQIPIPGRSAEWLDVVADVAGGLTGLVVFAVTRWRRRGPVPG